MNGHYYICFLALYGNKFKIIFLLELEVYINVLNMFNKKQSFKMEYPLMRFLC